MYSRLFRLETGRNLRRQRDEVVRSYLHRRFTWLNAFASPREGDIAEAVDVLAEAVERDDVSRYRSHTISYLRSRLEEGLAPIAVLAGADLLEQAMLDVLTPDQRGLVVEVLRAEQEQRQRVLGRWLASVEERGA